MKKQRLWLIAAIAALIGFVFAACDNSSSPTRCNHADSTWHIALAATCEDEGERELRCDRCDDVLETEMVAALGHDLRASANARVAPTCEEDGLGESYCARDGCDYTRAEGVIPALEHDWGAWVESLAAACEVAGEESRSCEREGCTHPGEQRALDALEHAPGNWVQTTTPSCTSLGIETGTCTREGCDNSNFWRLVDPLGHQLPAWISPTCETAGNSARTCERAGCDHVDTRISGYAPLGHDWGDWAQTVGGDITSLTAAIEMTRACSRNIGGAVCTETETDNKSLAQYITIMADQGEQPVFLPVAIDLGAMGTANNGWTQLLAVLDAADKRVALDLSSSTMSGSGGQFNTGATVTTQQAGMNAIASIVLPPVATTISAHAFRNADLTSVTIPAGITVIGEAAFLTNPNLTSVTFEDGSGLSSIGDHAFRDTGLANITIPASVSGIGLSAFSTNPNLTSVTFEDGSVLNNIGEAAFLNSGLISITIPASVSQIGNSAFFGSASLESVTVLATSPPTLGGILVFSGNHPDLQIKVPASSVTSYQWALNWSVWASRIIAIP